MARVSAQLAQNLGVSDTVGPLCDSGTLRDLDEVFRVELSFPDDFLTSTRQLVQREVGAHSADRGARA